MTPKLEIRPRNWNSLGSKIKIFSSLSVPFLWKKNDIAHGNATPTENKKNFPWQFRFRGRKADFRWLNF